MSVDSDLELEDDSWGKCLPDTLITYNYYASTQSQDSVVGMPCQLPFIMNEKYSTCSKYNALQLQYILTTIACCRIYEYCTRDSPTTYKPDEDQLTDEKSDNYWCAVVNNVNEDKEFNGHKNTRAFCTDLYYPKDNGCPETYEPVRR